MYTGSRRRQFQVPAKKYAYVGLYERQIYMTYRTLHVELYCQGIEGTLLSLT